MLDRIIRAVLGAPAAEESTEGDPARAAVALVFHSDASGDLRLLLIRRAERLGDPWSGQIALPGGRWSPGDDSLEATAIRETLEETGIDLRGARIVGRLDQLRPRTATLPPIIVTPVVAVLDEVPPLVLSAEVAEAFWASWSALADPATTRESGIAVEGGVTWRLPSFVIGEHVVWGMTERILRALLARLG